MRASLRDRKGVQLKLSCSYSHSPAFPCQSEMPKSPHLCRMSNSTNLRDLGAVIWWEFRSTPSLESSQELVAVVVPPLQIVLLVPTSLLPCLWRSSFFLHLLCLSSTGAGLILRIRPTFCAQMAFFLPSANRQRPCLDSDFGSDVDLLS